MCLEDHLHKQLMLTRYSGCVGNTLPSQAYGEGGSKQGMSAAKHTEVTGPHLPTYGVIVKQQCCCCQ